MSCDFIFPAFADFSFLLLLFLVTGLKLATDKCYCPLTGYFNAYFRLMYPQYTLPRVKSFWFVFDLRGLTFPSSHRRLVLRGAQVSVVA